MADKDLHREVIKLLVQVAWADREIAPEERDYIVGMAQGAQFDTEEIEELRLALEDPARLPAPDFEFLKRYKDDVRRAATVLIRMDRIVAPDEARMLEDIDRLLAG